MDARPIGIFDSSSGGLTIFQSIREMLPYESIVYVGDHAHIPYSTKSESFIRERGVAIIKFLLEKHVKLIVVACNTATVAGIEYYRKMFPHLPIVGVVPVIKTAAVVSKNRSFAVFSTVFTKESAYQKKLIETFASDCEVYTIGNSELIGLIEDEKDSTEKIEAVLAQSLGSLKHTAIDTLILGCTHFPLIQSLIKKIVGDAITILDSGKAVATQVARIVQAEHLENSKKMKPTDIFFTTGNPHIVAKVIQRYLGTTRVVKSISG